MRTRSHRLRWSAFTNEEKVYDCRCREPSEHLPKDLSGDASNARECVNAALTLALCGDEPLLIMWRIIDFSSLGEVLTYLGVSCQHIVCHIRAW